VIEFVITNNKLPNNFAGLVTCGLAPYVARWPPAGLRYLKDNLI
jgi:hypothetical protein